MRLLARQRIYERGAEAGFAFATLVHPWAVVASSVQILAGAQVLAGVVVGPGAQIGADAIINTRSSTDHDVIVGAHSHIAPGVTDRQEVRDVERDLPDVILDLDVVEVSADIKKNEPSHEYEDENRRGGDDGALEAEPKKVPSEDFCC